MFHSSNIFRAIYGTDYNGLTCGVDDAVKDKPYVAFPYLAGAPTVTICVNDCNATLTDPRIVPFNYYQSQTCESIASFMFVSLLISPCMC